jgi:hypothetical protein
LSSNAYITIVPYATPKGGLHYAYLEADETWVPNRRLRDMGIAGAGRPGRNPSLPILRILDFQRHDDLSGTNGALTHAVARTICLVGATSEARWVNLTVDVSHDTAGPIVARRTWDIQRALGRRCRTAIVDAATFELPKPERRGWRLAVGRRAIASALLESLQERRLQIIGEGFITQKEFEQQVRDFSVRPSRDEGAAGDDHLARAIAFTVWIQMVQPRAA